MVAIGDMAHFHRCPSEAVRITQCAAGACHSVLLSENGLVFTCGTGTAVGLGVARSIHAEFASVLLRSSSSSSSGSSKSSSTTTTTTTTST